VLAEVPEPKVVKPQPEDPRGDVAALAREGLQLAAVLPGQDFKRPANAFCLAPQTIVVEHRPLLLIEASFSAAPAIWQFPQQRRASVFQSFFLVAKTSAALHIDLKHSFRIVPLSLDAGRNTR